MDDWISVDDRLPESGVDVLCINERGAQMVGNIEKAEFIATGLDVKSDRLDLCYRAYQNFSQLSDVTHWMPLPEPPK